MTKPIKCQITKAIEKDIDRANEYPDNEYLNDLTPTGRSFLEYRRKWEEANGK